MGAGLANAAVAGSIVLLAVGALLTVIGLTSYKRTGQARLLWVSAGFIGLSIQGYLYLRQTYEVRGLIASGAEPFPALLILDLAVIAALYFAVLKR